MSTISNQKKKFTVKLLSVVWDRELWLTELSVIEHAQPAPLPKAHFRTTNEMLDEFAFLGEELARKLVIENTNALADIFEPVEVVKGTCMPFHRQG